MSTEVTTIGALRCWHIPQIPGKPFHVFVDTPEEAQRVLQVLAKYDFFQFENRIKPDYCNAAGLEVFCSDGDWNEWHDDETDCDIDEWVSPAAVSSAA